MAALRQVKGKANGVDKVSLFYEISARPTANFMNY